MQCYRHCIAETVQSAIKITRTALKTKLLFVSDRRLAVISSAVARWAVIFPQKTKFG